MSDYTRTPEGYLANILTLTAQDGVDVSKVLEQIPQADRPKVHAVLSGLYKQRSTTPISPAVTVATPDEVKKLVETLGLEYEFDQAMKTQKAFQLLKAGEKAPDFGQVLKSSVQSKGR